MKAMLDYATVNAYQELHKQMKIPYTLTISNYTTRIKSLAYDIHFMKHEQSNRCFAAFNMVKNDVIKKPMPNLSINGLTYFTEAFMPHDFYSDVIFNFDIKSAYATVLFNEGFITEKTFNYINALPKQERLTAIGMLAGKKNVFHIDKYGEIESEKTIISETANYFFYCVKRVYEIIQGAARLLGNGFLFSWVDGIYFLENPDSAENTAKIIIEHYFKEKNFKVTFEKINGFSVQVRKDYYHCSYRKLKADGTSEYKIMNVPKKENIIVKRITEHLINKNYKN